MEKFFTIALLLFCYGTTFGQEKGKPVYYDNWPTEIAANRDILKIKYSTTAKYVPIGSIWSKRILTYFLLMALLICQEILNVMLLHWVLHIGLMCTSSN